MHSWTPNSFVVLRASLRKYSSDTGSDYSQTRGNANAPGKILEQRNSSKTEVSSRIIAQIFPWWRRSNPTSKAPLQTEPPAPFQNINQQPDVVPIKVQLQFDGRLNWWKIILQDLLDTWNMIYAARKLILTFASILFAINRLYIYEADYLWSVFNRSKPTSSIARWVHSFSTVSMPRLPTYSEPSLSYTLLGCVAAEWLKTPLNFFTQISCSFACMDLPNVKDNILLLILLMPALKQVMSSKTISIAYVLGGFIAVNLHCASQYLFNPHSSLSTSELQRKLDAISLLEHQRSHRSKLWDDARTKLSTLSQDVVDLKDEEMRKEQSDDKTAGNKDPTDEKNVTDSPKETGINEEDLMLKGSREGNPAVTEFNKDGSSHAELTGNEIEKEKSNDPPVKDNEEVLEKKPSQDGVELNVADETAIAVDSSNNETTPPPPEKPLHQQIAEKLEEITKTKQEIAALQQTQLLFDYAGVSLGTSCSMTCLSTLAALTIPKSLPRLLLRLHVTNAISKDLTWIVWGNSDGICHIGHIGGNIAGLLLWATWLRRGGAAGVGVGGMGGTLGRGTLGKGAGVGVGVGGTLGRGTLGKYSGVLVLVPWLSKYYGFWKEEWDW